MKYRKLGASDLDVSEISLGLLAHLRRRRRGGLGPRLPRPRLRARHQLHRHRQHLRPRRRRDASSARRSRRRARDSYILATKLFFPMTDSDRGLSAAQIEKQLDASLKRLSTDYVDLYQCHRYDEETPLEETMQALTRAVESGKARYIGFSEWPADKIEAAIEMAGVARFVSSQPQYSLLWRAAGGGGDPALRRQRHLADRLVAARARRADRQICAGRAAAGGQPRDQRGDGRLDRHVAAPSGARSGAAAEAARRARPASASPNSLWPGCCASPMSPRPSSAPRGRARSTTMSPPRTRRSTRPCSKRPSGSWRRADLRHSSASWNLSFFEGKGHLQLSLE